MPQYPLPRVRLLSGRAQASAKAQAVTLGLGQGLENLSARRHFFQYGGINAFSDKLILDLETCSYSHALVGDRLA